MTTPTQEGANVLSEIHDREVRTFETHLVGMAAENTMRLAIAGRNFAWAKVMESLSFALNVTTTLGFAAGLTWLIRWWA